MKVDWKPIATAPQDGTNFLIACILIADEFDDYNKIIRKNVRERYVRVGQIAFGTVNVIPFTGGICTNEFFTHWAVIPDLPPDTE